MSGGSAESRGKRRLDRVGIQLYTVRQQMRADMPATLAAIAAMGFREVEFAGYFGRTSAQVRELLTANGLSSPSTHVGYNAETWDRALDDAAEKGHEYITVPSLPSVPRQTVDDWRRIAELFTHAAERAATRGLKFAYHNHDAEFRRIGDAVPFDILLDHSDPKVVSFQMDIFWLVKGGGDPLQYIRRHPDRFVMFHVKDSGGPPAHNQVDVGAGTIDFAGIYAQDAALQRVVRHSFVEHDQPADPMLFAKSAFMYLSAMEY